ncbi:MAG: glycosyltransferase [Pirellulaceae bacterium]|nr:glycosyltransferase [Pirellulaceae bacterium]
MSLFIPHLIPYLGKFTGGPAVCVARIAAGLSLRGHDQAIFHPQLSSDGPAVAVEPTVKTYSSRTSRFFGFRSARGLYKQLYLNAPRFSLVHSHSLWSDVNRVAYRIAQNRQIPHVITVHGTLTSKAFRRRQWKKRLVAWWFQNEALQRAACIHATSEEEYGDIRAFGVKAPVAVIPMPASPPVSLTSSEREALLSTLRIPAQKQCLLYLGRLHPVKGLERLIRAWSRLSNEHNQWHLVLAGPDEQQYRNRLERLVSQSQCAATVSFTGPLDEREKSAVFQASNLFVMPSDFENFGVAIVEAMMASLPIVTTTGTPWSALPSARAGWWIPPTVDDLEQTLSAAMAMPTSGRAAMGHRGQELARPFTRESVAASLEAVYLWLVGQREMPTCVRGIRGPGQWRAAA